MNTKKTKIFIKKLASVMMKEGSDYPAFNVY